MGKIYFFASLKSLKKGWDPDPLVLGTDPRSGSAPKCHGSPTLIKKNRVPCRMHPCQSTGAGQPWPASQHPR